LIFFWVENLKILYLNINVSNKLAASFFRVFIMRIPIKNKQLFFKTGSEFLLREDINFKIFYIEFLEVLRRPVFNPRPVHVLTGILTGLFSST